MFLQYSTLSLLLHILLFAKHFIT